MDTPVAVLTNTAAFSRELDALMEKARSGHIVTILVDGAPVARLQPEDRGEGMRSWLEEAARLRARLRAEGVAPFSAEEIVSLVHEGRKPLT